MKQIILMLPRVKLTILLFLCLPLAVAEKEINLPDSEIQILIMNFSDNAPDVYFRCRQTVKGEWCTNGQRIEGRWL